MISRQGGKRRWVDRLFLTTPFWFSLASLISLILILITIFLIKSDGLNLIGILVAIATFVFTAVFFSASYSVMVKQLKQSLNAEDIRQSAIVTAPLNLKSIINLIPPTNPNFFEQREYTVRDVYEKMLQGNATIFVLTGIVGCGKSTLAALVCRYSEQQRSANRGPFTSEPLWLEIDAATTISHITKTLFEQFGEIVPELDSMTPQMQAAMLLTRLKEIKPERLIVLDQFDKILDFQTGRVRVGGIGEWLDNLLSEQYPYKVLLTSRCWPIGPATIPSNERNKYLLNDLEDAEARQLLLNHGGSKINLAQPDEFQEVFTYCDKHVWALKLLAGILSDRGWSLSYFLGNNDEIGSWFEKLGRNGSYDNERGLDSIYNQLTFTQQTLLRIFSIFRKPVALDAVRSLTNSVDLKIRFQYWWDNLKETLQLIQVLRLSSKLDALIQHHLLKVIENPQTYYQLHQMVANYALFHFVERNEEANIVVLKVAHNDAAKYYSRQIEKCHIREEKQANRIEIIWHQYKAGYWQKAYHKLKTERIYFEANSQRENVELRKLCLKILSDEQLNLREEAFIYSQLGKICKALRNNIDALIYFTKSHEHFENMKDWENDSIALKYMSEIYSTLGDFRRAQEYRDIAEILDQNRSQN